ncbi:MAG TPA: hypothetical protein VEV38_09215 [Candidatus Eremiobacteraceae bacterium]|nr:hypothetical protein [Candidatus Eremiobacteraceae bacterium]
MPIVLFAVVVVLIGAATPQPAAPLVATIVLPPNFDPDHMIVAGDEVWIADSNLLDHTIFKLDASRTLAPVPMPSGLSGGDFALGTHGEIWMVADEPGKLVAIHPPEYIGKGPAQIVRIDPDGTLQTFKTSYDFANTIAIGPDGRPWFAASDYDVAEVAADGSIARVVTVKGADIDSMTLGPDGAMWFCADNMDKIGRIAQDRSVTYFDVPPNKTPRRIIAGPDGALWFNESSLNEIARITASGAVTQYQMPRPDAVPGSLAFDDKKDLWFTEGRRGRVGRMKPDGTMEDWVVAGARLYPSIVRVGTDGRIWVSVDEEMFRDDPGVQYPPSELVLFQPND